MTSLNNLSQGRRIDLMGIGFLVFILSIFIATIGFVPTLILFGTIGGFGFIIQFAIRIDRARAMRKA